MTDKRTTIDTSKSKSILTGLVSLGILVVLLLMGSIYWASIDLFTRTLKRAATIEALLVTHEFYAGVIGITIGVSAVFILLYSVRVTRRLSRAIDEARTMTDGSKQDRNQIRRWLFQQVKWRVMGLIAAGSSVVFILMSALYAATLYTNLKISTLAPDQLRELFLILRYNGIVVLITAGIAVIALLLCLPLLLRRMLGDIAIGIGDSSESVSLFQLPRILFNLDSGTLVEQLREKQFKAHLQEELDEPEDNTK